MDRFRADESLAYIARRRRKTAASVCCCCSEWPRVYLFASLYARLHLVLTEGKQHFEILHITKNRMFFFLIFKNFTSYNFVSVALLKVAFFRYMHAIRNGGGRVTFICSTMSSVYYNTSLIFFSSPKFVSVRFNICLILHPLSLSLEVSVSKMSRGKVF